MTNEEIEISLIVPLFNEEMAVGLLFDTLIPVLERLRCSYEIVCVNDGSVDGTLAALLYQRRHNPRVIVIDLARNFGKEAALKAGLDHVRGRAVIPMDADLQDPPELILELVAKWREGFEVVHAQRIDRSSDSWFKRVTAASFYRLHNRLADVRIPENVGDFRLLDRRVVQALGTLPERHRFMRGLVSWVGFRAALVTYQRAARPEGYSKWNALQLWNYALEGLTSFSTLPLKIWTYVGGFVSLLSFIYAAYLVFRALMLEVDVPGYTSTIVIVLFLGGLQLMGIGVLGEYIGRTYFESKQRPVYIVREVHR